MDSSLSTATTVSDGNAPRRWRPTVFIRFSLALHAVVAVTLVMHAEVWVWLVAALGANHLLLLGATLWPRGSWLGPNLVRLPASAVRRGEISLTFDDGPDPGLTPQVLELLDRHDAKASFFCIGEKAAAFPELVREIARRGHSVENHSYQHRYAFAFFGLSRLRREVDSAQETITAITGRPPAFFRAPAGFRSALLDPLLAARALCYASWTRRGFDSVSRDPQQILGRLTRGLSAGDVLLLHDNAPVVLLVLPGLLKQVAEQGLRSVSLATACEDPAL